MEILDTFEVDAHNTMYAVALAPGFVVDVKVCSETGLVYVMQNEDGSTVYDQSFADYTFPDYEYDEEAVIQFVKQNYCEAVKKEIKPPLDEMLNRASGRVKQQAHQTMDEPDKQIAFCDLEHY